MDLLEEGFAYDRTRRRATVGVDRDHDIPSAAVTWIYTASSPRNTVGMGRLDEMKIELAGRTGVCDATSAMEHSQMVSEERVWGMKENSSMQSHPRHRF